MQGIPSAKMGKERQQDRAVACGWMRTGEPCPALHLQSLICNFPTIAFGDPKEGYACDENFLATTAAFDVHSPCSLSLSALCHPSCSRESEIRRSGGPLNVVFISCYSRHSTSKFQFLLALPFVPQLGDNEEAISHGSCTVLGTLM